MRKISKFVQVRADGKLVPANMTVSEMLALGWQPSKVICLRWENNAATVEFHSQYGVHGIVVPGENFVAAMLDGSDSISGGQLVVLSADGSVHCNLENKVPFSGANVDGQYSWFEPAMEPEKDKFGAVFQERAGRLLRCDIDAQLGGVLKIAPIR